MREAVERIWRPCEIISRYQAGERDFRALDIDDPDDNSTDHSFRGAILASADFSGSFILADFSGADLHEARFARANVKTCFFDRANLRNADFTGAAICGATFDGADLSSANFDEAHAYGYTYAPCEVPARERGRAGR